MRRSSCLRSNAEAQDKVAKIDWLAVRPAFRDRDVPSERSVNYAIHKGAGNNVKKCNAFKNAVPSPR
jgi:hypothetical protein